jgi:hypothetical protein
VVYNPPVGGEILNKMKTIIKSMSNVGKGMAIFLFAMVPVVIIHHIVVVAKLPRTVDSLITRVYAIIEAMTDNAWFPNPSPDLVVLKGHNDALRNAQVLVKSRFPGSKADRDVKKNKVVHAVYALVAYVQGISDAHPESAVAIAESALLHAKKVSIRQKRRLSARCLGNGFIEITGMVWAKRCSHEWQMTKTPEVEMSWYASFIPSTLQSVTIVGNLMVGEKIYLRHRCVTKAGPTEWEEYICIFVL